MKKKTSLKVGASSWALLVDIVDSRSTARRAVHEHATTQLTALNERLQPLDPLRPTVGDEFQGVFAHLGAAIEASHRLRLLMRPYADVRFGIGGGDVVEIDPGAGIQDGSAWWAAREAIIRVEQLAATTGYARVRTAVHAEGGEAGAAGTAAIEPALQLIDVAISALKAGAVRALLGVLDGEEVSAIAAADEVSASAVSQRIINNDLRPLAAAMQSLWGIGAH